MSKPSKWAWWWIFIVTLIVVTDAIASKPPHHKPRSLSEYWKHIFNHGHWRWIGIGILALLFIHLASGPDVVPIAVLP